MPDQLTTLLTLFVTLAVPAAAALLAAALTNRHNRRLADADREHRDRQARAAEEVARLERRYDERRGAVRRVVDQATRLRDKAIYLEAVKNLDPPSSTIERAELEDELRPLHEAVCDVLLVCTWATREAAQRVELLTGNYIWDWDQNDRHALNRAIEKLLAEGRRDLGIDGESESSTIEA